ncbi:hypothetical protein N9N28_17120 [Rubripirellula amarantea]|nr:hypothetical protein [Rubripirellula amarantea]
MSLIAAGWKPRTSLSGYRAKLLQGVPHHVVVAKLDSESVTRLGNRLHAADYFSLPSGVAAAEGSETTASPARLALNAASNHAIAVQL